MLLLKAVLGTEGGEMLCEWRIAQFKLSGGGGKEGAWGREGLKCLKMSFGGIDLLMMVVM